VPELLEKTDIEPSYVQLMTEASISVLDVEQLVAAVEEGFANPRQKSGSRREVAGEMFYQPGGATARAIAEMYEVIELDRV
jgi:hypothetical protein